MNKNAFADDNEHEDKEVVMWMSRNKVRQAVSKIGGVTRVSNLLGVSNGAVHAWIKQERVPNIELAQRLAKLAGMNVEEVRPI